MSLTRPLLPALAVATLLASVWMPGCSGEPTATPPVDKPPTEAPVDEKAPPPPALDMAALEANAVNVALVPSPAEMQKAMEKAGIVDGLSKLVTDRALKMDVENKDVVAVRTGLVLADCLLTVKDAPKEKIVERLGIVKSGMHSLGAGGDIQATIDELSARITNDGISKDDLIKELDDMHGAIIPEIKYEAGDRAVPLIQAGAWLEGSNLVSTAILAANKPDAATQLLRQPQVVDYFLTYVKTEGADKAPDAVLKQLESTLNKLKEIAAKPTLNVDDVKEIKAQTDSVLALL